MVLNIYIVLFLLFSINFLCIFTSFNKQIGRSTSGLQSCVFCNLRYQINYVCMYVCMYVISSLSKRETQFLSLTPAKYKAKARTEQRGKFLTKLWYCVGGEYNKIIWFLLYNLVLSTGLIIGELAIIVKRFKTRAEVSSVSPSSELTCLIFFPGVTFKTQPLD